MYLKFKMVKFSLWSQPSLSFEDLCALSKHAEPFGTFSAQIDVSYMLLLIIIFHSSAKQATSRINSCGFYFENFKHKMFARCPLVVDRRKHRTVSFHEVFHV